MKHISCQIPTGDGRSNTLGILITEGELGDKEREHVLVVEQSLQPGSGIVCPSPLTLIKTNSGGGPVAHPFQVVAAHCTQDLYSYDIKFI